MWEYKIYKTSLGYGIYRKKDDGKVLMLQFLDGKNTWTLNKTIAKTFYNIEDAVSALVLMKNKDGREKSD